MPGWIASGISRRQGEEREEGVGRREKVPGRTLGAWLSEREKLFHSYWPISCLSPAKATGPALPRPHPSVGTLWTDCWVGVDVGAGPGVAVTCSATGRGVGWVARGSHQKSGY